MTCRDRGDACRYIVEVANLLMHIANQHRFEHINALPLREELKLLLTCKLQLGPFDEYFSQPTYFYSEGYPENPGNWPTFAGRTLLPLWQHYDRIFALDTNTNPAQVISWYIECPDEYRMIQSLDHAIFEMIELHVWEYGVGEAEAEEAVDFAQQIAMPNAKQLQMLMADPENCTEEMISEYKSRF